MRRLFAWIAGTAGGLAAYRLVARRRGTAALSEPPAPESEVDPRAEALRAKLEESRQAEPEATATAAVPDAGETEAIGSGEGDPDTRRQAVHEHGRAAVEEMRGGEEAAEESQ
ncbi:MAG TPA: hypothetical protein VNH40_09355 [Gaiellaceae bacterium]|nr:hypothetical protein [Gaiellaceae bacterium]